MDPRCAAKHTIRLLAQTALFLARPHTYTFGPHERIRTSNTTFVELRDIPFHYMENVNWRGMKELNPLYTGLEADVLP